MTSGIQSLAQGGRGYRFATPGRSTSLRVRFGHRQAAPSAAATPSSSETPPLVADVPRRVVLGSLAMGGAAATTTLNGQAAGNGHAAGNGRQPAGFADANNATAPRGTPFGIDAARDAAFNRGLATTQADRDRLGLSGLIPAGTASPATERLRAMAAVSGAAEGGELAKYRALIALQATDEDSFFGAVIRDLPGLLPILYTPTVGDACLQFGSLIPRPSGLWISLEDRGRVAALLARWPSDVVIVAVITDGERILGLGDLGAHGMAIAAGKSHVYSAVGGIPPSAVLPILVDAGTDNEALRASPLYCGLRRPRERGAAYDALMEELVDALQARYGRLVVAHWEDLGGRSAGRVLAKFAPRASTFNDDIQGTAAVVLAGLLAAKRAGGAPLPQQRVLFFGAGQANLGAADLLVKCLVSEGVPEPAARKQIWLFDSRGLVVLGRKGGPLPADKARFAHDPAELFEALPAAERAAVAVGASETVETVARGGADDSEGEGASLAAAVAMVRPTALLGAAAAPGRFTRDVLGALEEANRGRYRPVVMALSNPVSLAECTAEEALVFTHGAAIFASGSPFGPVTLPSGRVVRTGLANNALIFPGLVLGATSARASRLSPDLFLAAARALAEETSPSELAEGGLYPGLSRAREATAAVAAAVATQAVAAGAEGPAAGEREMADTMWMPRSAAVSAKL